MIVYDALRDQFSHQFCSKQLSTAERILLTSNLHFMITVESENVSIWRLESVIRDGYKRYCSDNGVNDDEQDDGANYYDDYDDDKRQDIVHRKVSDFVYFMMFFQQLLVITAFTDVYRRRNKGTVKRKEVHLRYGLAVST
jgi:hypothetical protein